MNHEFLLQYSNSMFDVEANGQKYRFSNSFLKEQYEKFVQSSDVKQIYYQPNSERNTIVYKDGSKDRLEPIDYFFEDLIAVSNIIGPAYKLKLIHDKEKMVAERSLKRSRITPYSLFDHDVTVEKQDELLTLIKEVEPTLVIDDKYFLEQLQSIKKEVLSKTDWTQLPDVQAGLTEEEKTKWLEYRAAIRSIDEATDLKAVRLPKPPKDIY